MADIPEVTINTFSRSDLFLDMIDLKTLMKQMCRGFEEHALRDDIEKIADAGCLFFARASRERPYDHHRNILATATLSIVVTLTDIFGWVHAVVSDSSRRGKDTPPIEGKSITQYLMEQVIAHAAHKGMHWTIPHAQLSHLVVTSCPDRKVANALYSGLGFVKAEPSAVTLYRREADTPFHDTDLSDTFESDTSFSLDDMGAIRKMFMENNMFLPDFKRIELAYDRFRGRYRTPFFARLKHPIMNMGKIILSQGEIVGTGCVNCMITPTRSIALISDVMMRDVCAGSDIIPSLVSHGVGYAFAMGADEVRIRCTPGWFNEYHLADLGFHPMKKYYYTFPISISPVFFTG